MPIEKGSVLGSAKFGLIWICLGLLLVVSLVVTPGSIQNGSLIDLLYFGSLLAAIAMGQHIVVVGGGIDLSVAAQLTLGSLIFAYSAESGQSVGAAALWTLLVCGLCGLANGFAVTVLRITPLIATLGIASLILGFAYAVPGAVGALQVPAMINDLAVSKPLFGMVSRGTIAMVVLAALLAAAFRWTRIGRTYSLIGDNARTALVRGFRVKFFKLGSYVVASFIYGLSAIWLAGLANTPGITLGDPYLLSSIAAVVIGGTSLGGGRGSVFATIGGAFFLTQLKTLSLSLHAPIAAQFIIEGATIAAGMTIYNMNFPMLLTSLKTPKTAKTKNI